jgi:nucleoside phosphorylase
MDVCEARRILVVMAMAGEARPLLEALAGRWGTPAAATELEPPLPMRCWRFPRPGGGEVVVAINGEDPLFGVDSVGTQPAVLATHAGVRRFRPGLVLTVGTAGALPGAAGVGEVCYAKGFRFHDRRIHGVGEGFERYGVYPLPAAPLPDPAGFAPARRVLVSSGNALNPVPDDFRIMRAEGATLKEMEGAAVAWAAGLHGVPCGGVKSVTNVYGEEEVAGRVERVAGGDDEAAQFRRNFEDAVGALARHVPALLDALLEGSPGR